MKIPGERELAIKKAILTCIDRGESFAQLADFFGVSKSTIYNYRNVLTTQGFITKLDDGSYSIVENKFSSRQNNEPKIHTLDLSFPEDEIIEININEHHIKKEQHIENINEQHPNTSQLDKKRNSSSLHLYDLKSLDQNIKNSKSQLSPKKSFIRKIFSRK